MPVPSHDSPEKRSRSGPIAALVVVALLMAYVGSYALLAQPVIFLTDAGKPEAIAMYPQGWLESFYAPVHWVDCQIRPSYWVRP